MSERKTAEIKFRVTPTEKAAWQQYAADSQLGLSELIRREVNAGIRALELQQEIENARLDGTALIDNAIALLSPDAVRTLVESGLPVVFPAAATVGELLGPCRGEGMGDVALCAPCVEAGGCKLPVAPVESLLDTEDLEVARLAATPQEDVPTSDEVGAKVVLNDTAQATRRYSPQLNPMAARLLTDDEIADFRAQSSENVKPDWTFEAQNG